MRVLVTGASGFVGVHLVQALLAEGHEVAGTYIREAAPIPGATLVEADLVDIGEMSRVIDRFEPEAVIHLAGLSHVGSSWSRMDEYFKVNVLGTEVLLDLVPGRRVLVASSAEIYGVVPEEEQPIVEARMAAPRSPYAMTKAAMERLALARDAIVVRSFNSVGPGQAASFALPTFAAQLADIARGRQEPLLNVGNLAARRDFIHVVDAAAAYTLLLDRGRDGEVYNLGTGVAHSVAEVLDRLMEISGVECEVVADPERYRPIDLPLLQAETSRLRKLGWAPERSLEDALTDLWRAVSTGRDADGALAG